MGSLQPSLKPSRASLAGSWFRLLCLMFFTALPSSSPTATSWVGTLIKLQLLDYVLCALCVWVNSFLWLILLLSMSTISLHQDTRINSVWLKQNSFTLYTGCFWKRHKSVTRSLAWDTAGPAAAAAAVVPTSSPWGTRVSQTAMAAAPLKRMSMPEPNSTTKTWPPWSSLCFSLLPSLTGSRLEPLLLIMFIFSAGLNNEDDLLTHMPLVPRCHCKFCIH